MWTWLEEMNVGYHEYFVFRVTDEGDAPGGGPHIWFMRRDVSPSESGSSTRTGS